jgi:two-component system sensor histidine kinase AgrC
MLSFAQALLVMLLTAKVMVAIHDRNTGVTKAFIAAFFASTVITNLSVYAVLFMGFKDMFPKLPYLLITTANPLFVVFYCIMKFKGLNKSFSAQLISRIYLYYIITSNLCRLTASLFFAQFGLRDNYFTVACQQLCSMVMALAIYFLIIKFINSHKQKLRVFEFCQSSEQKGMILPFLAQSAVLYLLLAVLQVKTSNGFSGYLTELLILILMLAVNALMVLHALEKICNNVLNSQLDAMKVSMEEFNGLKHDFYNILGTYSGFLEVGSLEQLKKYHESLTSNMLHAGSAMDLSNKMEKNPALITLLMNKAEYAKNQQVLMQIQIRCDISSFGVNEIDVCRMISCLCDNAIEAAAASKRKRVTLTITKNQGISKLIMISNSTAGPVDIAKISKLGASSKEGHMGVGVNNIEKIVRSNENCNLTFSYYDYEFTAYLDIKNLPSFTGSKHESLKPGGLSAQ